MAKPQTQMTESQMDQVTKDTASVLKEQDKVKVRLYLSPDEKNKLEAQEKEGKQVQWPFQTVCVNGHIYQIQRGKTVEVPQTVAEILEQAGEI
ncbi:hypothetical protein [Brevibacillus centrosporus]|uniref:hypothetical protein n=1 Tax=Brevibacillus centrosporus TaxID=54910 RepID=UPI002E238358|nr:hypothetical protein [Brevibacillus centrosporus]